LKGKVFSKKGAPKGKSGDPGRLTKKKIPKPTKQHKEKRPLEGEQNQLVSWEGRERSLGNICRMKR